MSGSEHADAYRESFKYFKSYSLPLTSGSRRTPRKGDIIDKKWPHNSSKKDHDHSSSGIVKGEGAPCGDGDNSKNGSGEHAGDIGWNVAYRGIILPYHPEGSANDEGRCGRENVVKLEIDLDGTKNCHCYEMWGLRPPETWTVVELTFPEGLIVIKNPFNSAGQRYWITRALLDFPHHPDFVTNMDNLNRLEKMKKGGTVDKIPDFKLDTCSKDFYEKLRWVTFGYHHDWDTKIYSEKMRSQFPEDLADMTRYISQVLKFSQFEAEAAIANYYHMDSTLSGHVDRSEVNQRAPLFSLSFGQSAIFLIGGKTKAEVPQPVLLQSGDIAIMSGESRMSYHGVPKILPSINEPWCLESIDENCIQSKSVNEGMSFSKRQKLDVTAERFHDCISFNATLQDSQVFNKMKEMKWTDFVNDYIRKSRINLNIRQVLFPGQSGLS